MKGGCDGKDSWESKRKEKSGGEGEGEVEADVKAYVVSYLHCCL